MYKRFLFSASIVLVGMALVFAPPIVEKVWLGRPLFWLSRDRLWFLVLAAVLSSLSLFVYGRHTSGSLFHDLKQSIQLFPRRTATAFGLAVSLLILLVIDAGFGILLQISAPADQHYTGADRQRFYENDPVVGYKPRAGCTVGSQKSKGLQPIYDVTYRIGEDGYRITPESQPEGEPVVLFFGGSFTFGEGVNDDETLPNQFCLAAGGARVVNAGFCGYGPQQMLASLENGRWDSFLQGRDIIAIYVFIDDHVRRAIGSMYVVSRWGSQMPCYQLESNGHVIRAKSFLAERRILCGLYGLVATSNALRYLDVDLPHRIKPEYFALTAQIIEQSSRLLAAKSASSRMFVVLYPDSTTGTTVARYLRDESIEIVDFSDLFSGDRDTYVIPFDGHPNSIANQRLGFALAKRILP
ncbi:MAG: hypothetical protein P8N76_07865 [Pirellulaceae bacterium]|nr:hypothetical protein [Pirellulaceae bacterium]